MNKKILLLVSLFLWVNFCYAQNRQLTGIITDAGSGERLPGASITIKGTTKSFYSDANGQYNLTITGNNLVLSVKFMGYRTQEIAVLDKSKLDIKLQAFNEEMDEVVVIGYAVVKKKDLTGAVSSLNAKQLKDVPTNSAEQSLAGRLAGVQVTGSEGSLDAEVKIVVRGGGSITQDNSPLYIIDGIQVEEGLSSLSPQDIESIDVLKDASATAIYGSRGANGVVIVTTKGGKEGVATVNYNGFAGVNQLVNKLDVLDPYDFVLYQYERSRGNASDELSFSTRYATTFDGIAKYRDYAKIDWQQKVMGNDALMQTHNVNVNGGTKSTKFNFSYSNNQQKGVVLNTDYKRNLFNVKLDQTVSDKFKIGFTLRYSNTGTNGAGTSDPSSASFNGLRNIVKYRPLSTNGTDEEEFDEDYFNDTNAGNGLGIINPVVIANAKYRKSKTDLTNFGGFGNYNFNNLWSLRSTVGINYNIKDSRAFNDVLTSTGALPSAAFGSSKTTTLNQSNVLTYSNALSKSKFRKKNEITVLLGQEIFTTELTGLTNQLMDYPRGITAETALNQLTQGTVRPGYPVAAFSRSTLLSFFGRANYNFNKRYLATLTVRGDGSSKFAEGHKWGYFPSGSIAWRISEEDFMEKVDFISDLKLRLSYGNSGNNRIKNYAYQTSFSATELYGLNNSLNTFGYESVDLANPNLKWETTISKNIGLDFAFLKNRIQVSLDMYRNVTRDVLTNVPISPTSGYATQLQNTATTLNKGLEAQISASVINGKKFKWNTDFNISFNKNTIQELSNGLDFYYQNSGWGISGQPADYIVKVGESVGSIYGYVSDGFYTVNDFDYDATTSRYSLKTGVANPSKVIGFAQPGLMKVKDISGDGLIGEDDKQIIGDATPSFFGGLNQQFTYKNFDASVFVNFQLGNDILNANKIEFTNGYAGGTNMLKFMKDRWQTVDAQGNILQSISTAGVVTGVAPELLAEANKEAAIWMPLRGNPSYYPTSWAVESGSFLRINNISVGYTLEAAFLKKINIKRLRIYSTVNNVAILTKYSGYDPEVNTRRATPVTPGVDYSAYPRSRSFLFGLNFSL